MLFQLPNSCRSQRYNIKMTFFGMYDFMTTTVMVTWQEIWQLWFCANLRLDDKRNESIYWCNTVTHVPWCMPGSLTRGFIWSRWQGKRSRHSQRMRNPQFYVSGKRPIGDKPFSESMVTHFIHVCAPLGLGVRLGILTNVLFGTITDKVLQHIPKVFWCASLIKSLDHFSYLLLQVL